jgi:hypothetical protein
MTGNLSYGVLLKTGGLIMVSQIFLKFSVLQLFTYTVNIDTLKTKRKNAILYIIP